MTQTLSLKHPNNSYDNQSYTTFAYSPHRDSFIDDSRSLTLTTNSTHNTGTSQNESSTQNSTRPQSSTSSSTTLFEKLCYNIKNNTSYTKEILLGKLIGFYRIGDEIGSGNFSKVKRGAHLLTKEKIAIKILDKTQLDTKTQRLLLREISSMEKLRHPNIIRLYEVIHRPSRLYICMEFACHGELYTRVNQNGAMKDHEARFVFSQIISAVDHMHSQNIIHRDIKAENIFFSSLHPLMIKIGDFGFSINATTKQNLNTYCGSPPYAAPELFQDDNYIGIYVDIWALGVLLFFIMTSNMPFKADTVGKLKRIILSNEYVIPSYVSDSCQLLIRGILKHLPADRFSIKEIMESAWLDGEKFSSELEPYVLNPTLDKNCVDEDELRGYEILDKVGLGRDMLICNNLQSNTFNPTKYRHFFVKDNNDKEINLNPIPILAKELDLFIKENISKNFANMMKNLSPEMKQAINGSFRIIFHRIHTEAKKNKILKSSLRLQYEPTTLSGITTKNNLLHNKDMNPLNDYGQKFHSSEKIREKSRPGSGKSIFVKVNNNNINNQSSMKNLGKSNKNFYDHHNQVSPVNNQNIFTNNSQNRFDSGSLSKSKGQNQNINQFNSQSVYQMNDQSRNIDFKSKLGQNRDNTLNKGKSSLSSSQPGAGPKVGPVSPSNRSLPADSAKQASKLCAIL